MSEQGRSTQGARVAILDNDVLAQYALESILSGAKDIRLVMQTKDAGELQATPAGAVDLALLALETVLAAGIDLTEYLGKLTDRMKVLVISSRVEPELVVACLRAGAAGFLWKGVAASQIRQAVLAAIAGEHPIQPPIAGDLLFHVLNGSSRKNRSCFGLTNRELEVLSLVARGMSNKEIASTLQLSVRTVKAHISSMLQKLNLADRTQAAVMAIRLGVVSTEHAPAVMQAK